jgi:uncharacterized protein YegP (UPF0339 family)
MPSIFEVYKNGKGEYRFRLKATNGEVIAVSEGYASKQNCLNGIDSVKINAATAIVVEQNPDRDLLKACEQGDLPAARKALGQGANPNVFDPEGEPAIKEAVESRNLELVKLLVRHKALIHQSDIHGETPLHEASDEGHVSIVQFLIKQGAKIDVKDNKGNMPIHKALMKGHALAAQALVRAGAKINIPNYEGKTAEKLASEKAINIAVMNTPPKKTANKVIKKVIRKAAKKVVAKKKKR